MRPALGGRPGAEFFRMEASSSGRAATLALTLIAVVAIPGCNTSRALPTQPLASEAVSPARSRPIRHVILMIQENRSFDDFFATFPGADGATSGKLRNRTVRLHEASLLERCDLGHGRESFRGDYDNGKMDGFYAEIGTKSCPGQANLRPYQYVHPKQIAPYWDIAREWVLADHMFSTQGSGSFTAHQDLIRGGTTIDEARTETLVDFPTHEPWGCNAPAGTVTSYLTEIHNELKYELHKGPFPCTKDFPSSGAYYATLRDLLDAKNVSWKYYVPALDGLGGLWNAFDVIASVRYGPEWKKNISSPETSIFLDISDGTLPAMSWVIPDLKNSDHPTSGSDTGPSWIATVVNAIGESSYWDSTAIIVVWDDWGGFYDHEPPPFFDHFGGLGFRVPMLIVSPYARETSSSQPGYISHTQYEFGSILKFIERTWGLGSLGTTDARAKSIVDSFDFAQKPRAFVQIPTNYSRAFFEYQRPSRLPVDTE